MFSAMTKMLFRANGEKETFKITTKRKSQAKGKKKVRYNIWFYYKKESRIKIKGLIKLVLVSPNLYSVLIEEENNNTIV